jgi:hypothetical protein
VDELESVASPVQEAILRVRRAGVRDGEITLPPLQSPDARDSHEDVATLQLIASAVREIAPRHVVEFGCGLSTELLARLAFDHGRMAVTTFEHDPWAAEELLAASGALAMNYRWFSFGICPLVARRCGAEVVPVYDDAMIVPTVPYPADLVLISGPPRAIGGRGGTIYQALKYARPGTIVLLLDVRAEEGELIESWMRDLSAHIQFVPPGLQRRHLAFVVHEPLREPFVLAKPAAQAQAAAAACAVGA